MRNWGKLGVKTALALALTFTCSGCAMWGYRSVHLDSEMLNEGNCLLTVEGDTNLPSGTPLVCTLGENGAVLSRAQTVVQEGQYSMVLNIADLEGNTRFDLEVFTEPSLWNEEQKDKLGQSGQYMVGRQVEEAGHNYKLSEHYVLVLPMNKRDSAIRRIKNGDYAYGVATLEEIVEQDPKDEQAIAWLAIALIRNNKSERHLNSRAYDLLHSIKVDKLPKNLRAECQPWIERWHNEAEKIRVTKERQRIIAQNRYEAKLRQLEIVPGRRMADIAIGADSKAVFKVCPLHTALDWSEPVVRYDVPAREITVFFDSTTRRVVEVATESPAIRHVSGLHVGSELSKVMEVFPGGELSWEEQGENRSGVGIDEVATVQYGQYSHPKGIVFGLKREVLGLGLNLETVVSISITGKQ